MKGLELPINIIIVIAVAVLVLVVIIAYFVGSFGRDSETVQLRSAWDRYCADLRISGCINYNPGTTFTINNKPYPISTVCAMLYPGETNCQVKCCGGA